FGPKPHERQFPNGIALERQSHHLVKNVLDRSIHRPAWESDPIPTVQVDPLQMLAEGNRHERPDCVIRLSCKRPYLVRACCALAIAAYVSLITKVVHHFGRIERQDGI